MTDHPGKRPLMDDAAFDARLDDLDRGMSISASRWAAVRDGFGEQHTASTERRLRHDVFRSAEEIGLRPPGAPGGERPPGPLLGTAIGPRLAHGSALDGWPRPTPLDVAPTDEGFYGIAEKPFDLSPDPRFFYPGAAHERVIQQLSAAISERHGVALLTGEPGVGKTTVCRVIAASLDRRTVTSLLVGPFGSFHDLLTTVLADFGAASRDDLARAVGATAEQLSATLRSFLESLAPLHAHAVIIVDEAQELPADVLPRLLAVVEAGQEMGLLQMILVGQPALGAILRRQELRALADRVSVRAVLGPLGADEIPPYVAHRLTVAGSSGRVVFSDASFPHLYALSRGVPRVVNLLCDCALSRGRQMSASVIDAGLVDAAAEDLALPRPVVEERATLGRLWIALVLVALMLAGAAGALWVFRDAVARMIQ